MSGWETVALEKVADIERDGVAASAIRDGTLYVGLENIQSGGYFIDVRAVDEGELASSKFAFTEEHLLYGKLRPYLAKIARPTFAGVCSTDILPIKPGPLLDRDYLGHFLRQPGMVDFANSRATGANLPRLSPRVLASFEIPLPPLPEQRRIAAILDQAETLRTQRRTALAQLDSLTQSIFLDMFGDPVMNDRDWPKVRIDAFVAGFESGRSLVADDEEDASSTYRVLKVSAVTSLEYKPEQSKAVPSDYVPPLSHIVRAGDLLFSRANTTELIGATAYVEKTPDNLLLPDKLWRFVWHKPSHTTPLYVRHLFRQPKFRQEIGQRASGTSGSMKNISHDKVLSIEVGHPPLPLQQTFATRVQAIEALKTQHRAALAELDALFASLQHRAFSGELTAQPPHQPTPRSFTELGQLNANKGVEALVYAARRLPGKGHYWPLKAQYVADRRHLERHGRTLYGETHVAMPYGPVPQAAFNASRALAEGELLCEFPMDAVRAALRRDGDRLVALRDADPHVLGADERESLDWAIRIVADLSFDELKNQTHDSAWEKTPRNAPMAWQDIVATLDPAAQQRLLKAFKPGDVASH